MPKKGNSEGSIYFNKQRKNWMAQYYDFDVEKDKTIRKTKTFKTKEDAQKYLDTIMYQKQNPVYIQHHGIPLCEILRSNLELKLKTNLIGPAQYGRTLHSINKLEKYPFAHKNIDTITSDEIQDYLNSLTPLSNSMIAKAHQQLNQAFNIATDKGYIMANPMSNVIRPKSDKEDKIVRALTVEEQQAFTEWLLNTPLSKCKYRNIFLLQMYMGLRIGEASALSTHNIDLGNKRLHICRTLTTDKDWKVIMGNKTKTYAGNRTLPIPDFLLPYIMEQMQVANNQINNKEDLLFKPLSSNYVRRTTVNALLKRVLKKEFNITDITTHSLRHTFGTRCIESRNGSCCCSKINGP